MIEGKIINQIKIHNQTLCVFLTAENTYSIGYLGFSVIQHKCNHREVFNILEEQINELIKLSRLESHCFVVMQSFKRDTKSISKILSVSINCVESLKSKIAKKLDTPRNG
jgi:hypothetical protein